MANLHVHITSVLIVDFIAGEKSSTLRRTKGPLCAGMNTAFLFPGQGSQYVGMGKAWYRASDEARVLCEQADVQLGYALTRLCFEGSEAELERTEIAQPAIFVMSLAMWYAARANLPQPCFVAGHSLGEFAALVVAGALAFEAALTLVAERGRLMGAAGAQAAGGMAVLLGATLQQAQALCTAAVQTSGASLVVANDNCPGQVVISGALAALEAAFDLSDEYGIRRMRRLAVSVAPHSPLMAGSQDGFAQLLEAAPIVEPHVPVVLNATARPVQDPGDIRQALLRQLTAPVRWRESLLWLYDRGVDHYVEIGPKDILSGLVKRTLKNVKIEALDSAE